MATNPGVLKLEANVPAVIALAFADGREVESSFGGNQVMFSLVDGRKFYAAPFVAEKIKQAGIPARTPFEIVKRQVGRAVEYEIHTHNQNKAAGFSENPTASTSLVQQPVLNRNTNHFEMPNPVHTPAQQAVVQRKLADAMPAAACPTSAMANRILASYVVAFDVVKKLQEACEERGLKLNFLQEEHVRAIAATAFIEANKAAR